MRKILYCLPFAIVLLSWYFYRAWLPKVNAQLDPLRDLTSLGTFGDSFGALNTLFSGMAFAGILVSIFQQSHEISEAKADLIIQRKQQQKQIFETAFFQLLSLSNEIVRNTTYTSYFTKTTTTGKDCFAAIKVDYVRVALLSNHWGNGPAERYAKFYEKHAHYQLGHYFRNLYQIVKYVDAFDISDKKFYTNIVRAQLSSNELYLLFYNGLSHLGREKFFPLLRSYEFFEHLPAEEEVLQSEAEVYGIGAFGKSPEWHARFSVAAA